jgi:hypothetical protein
MLNYDMSKVLNKRMYSLKTTLSNIYFFLNSIPIVLNLIFINYVTLKVLNITAGGKLASLFLGITTLVSLLNVFLSKPFSQLKTKTKLSYAIYFTFFSSAIVCAFAFFSPINLTNFAIFIGLFSLSAVLQQSKNLLVFKIPYLLNQYKMFDLNKSTVLTLVIERVSRGIAPGIAFTIMHLDWSIVCSLYAVGNLISILALYLLRFILSNKQLNLRVAKEKPQKIASSAEKKLYSNTAKWNNIFQLLLNFFISPVTFIYIYIIKGNIGFRDGVITPLTLLYTGVLFASMLIYSNRLKSVIRIDKWNPFDSTIYSVAILGVLFLCSSLVQYEAFWVISLFIGISYGFILLINSNLILKLLHKSNNFLRYVASAQFYTTLAVLPSYMIVGYVIDLQISYQIMFLVVGVGCIFSAVVLFMVKNFLGFKASKDLL